jgi:translin
MALKIVLYDIQKTLELKEEVREEIHKIMRKATRLSKQSILYIHQKKFSDAENLLKETKQLFQQLQKLVKKHPDLMYMGLVDAAFQEYAEAHLLMRLIKKEKIATPKELDIPAVSYVLGLSDVIGELRREVLDMLRGGNIKKAEDYLELMDTIYDELIAMDNGYLLIPGLRRKCDTARRVIEATRGDVIVEIRKNSLERSIKKLEKLVKETLDAYG